MLPRSQGRNALRLKDPYDVTIIVDGRQFEVRKNIMSACSPYFEEIFTNGMAESDERTVTLHGLDNEAVKIIVDFTYTGLLSISDSTVQPLLATASFLQIEELHDKCSDYFKKTFECRGMLWYSRYRTNMHAKI